jgi:Fe-S-cluster containining protein
MSSRRDRRIGLKQNIDAVSRHGMDVNAKPGDQSWAVIAATRVIYDILRGHSPSRASASAKWTHEFFERSLKRAAPTPPAGAPAIACAKGCAFCCHLSVSALAPEIFLIANHIRDNARDDFQAVLARVGAAERSTRGLGGFERARRKLPCALLDGDACSVYAARPGPCRATVSLSAQTCEHGYHGENVRIAAPAMWGVLRNAHLQALWAGLSAANLPGESYELNHAVMVALETPDAEARWLKGEDVFAGVAKLRIENAAVREHNNKIIARLVAGALGKEMPPE